MTDTSNKSVIQTAGLTKIFRDFWGHKRVIAVDHLDLEVRPAEVYGLLGPNGSGKSTTIKMLLGLLFPSKGWAKVLGQPPGDVKTNRRIGYLPEESHLYPFLNARETLDFYGRLFSLSSQDRRSRIDSLLDMVGLSSVARRPVGEYSKGMARRIGLAQALINDPDLLILDEPTSGLDPIGTRQIKDLICELGRRGKTVLLCSHLLADVEDVCDRIAILYGGKIQSQGSVEELLAQSDVTQIRAPRLDRAVLEKIETLIRHQHHHYQLDAQSPRTRLEDFFLHTVSQAQAAQIATSGAVVGSGVSDFLAHKPASSETSQELIQELVAGGAVKPASAETSPESDKPRKTSSTVRVEPVEQIQREVLDSLVDSSTVPVTADTHSPEEAPSLTTPVTPVAKTKTSDQKTTSADSQVDQSLIEELTKPRSPDRPGKTSSPESQD